MAETETTTLRMSGKCPRLVDINYQENRRRPGCSWKLISSYRDEQRWHREGVYAILLSPVLMILTLSEGFCHGGLCLQPSTVMLRMELHRISSTIRDRNQLHRVSKKTSTHIIGYKLRNSCPILIIFDIKIPHII